MDISTLTAKATKHAYLIALATCPMGDGYDAHRTATRAAFLGENVPEVDLPLTADDEPDADEGATFVETWRIISAIAVALDLGPVRLGDLPQDQCYVPADPYFMGGDDTLDEEMSVFVMADILDELLYETPSFAGKEYVVAVVAHHALGLAEMELESDDEDDESEDDEDETGREHAATSL